METTDQAELKPARVLPPGFTLKRELQARGIKQQDFAAVIERPKQFVSELIRGKRRLSVDTAHRLEAALGIPAYIWLGREVDYRTRIETLDPQVLNRIRSAASRFDRAS